MPILPPPLNLVQHIPSLINFIFKGLYRFFIAILALVWVIIVFVITSPCSICSPRERVANVVPYINKTSQRESQSFSNHQLSLEGRGTFHSMRQSPQPSYVRRMSSENANSLMRSNTSPEIQMSSHSISSGGHSFSFAGRLRANALIFLSKALFVRSSFIKPETAFSNSRQVQNSSPIPFGAPIAANSSTVELEKTEHILTRLTSFARRQSTFETQEKANKSEQDKKEERNEVKNDREERTDKSMIKSGVSVGKSIPTALTSTGPSVADLVVLVKQSSRRLMSLENEEAKQRDKRHFNKKTLLFSTVSENDRRRQVRKKVLEKFFLRLKQSQQSMEIQLGALGVKLSHLTDYVERLVVVQDRLVAAVEANRANSDQILRNSRLLAHPLDQMSLRPSRLAQVSGNVSVPNEKTPRPHYDQYDSKVEVEINSHRESFGSPYFTELAKESDVKATKETNASKKSTPRSLPSEIPPLNLSGQGNSSLLHTRNLLPPLRSSSKVDEPSTETLTPLSSRYMEKSSPRQGTKEQ